MRRQFLVLLTLIALAFGPLPAAQAAPSCRGEPATIIGTSGADTIVGTSLRDVIVARGGDDIIRAKEGDDLVCANGGNDTVIAGDGDDVVMGGNGDDRINGGEGADLLDGGRGSDVLRGGRADDVILGGPGGDSMDGGRGIDEVSYAKARRGVTVNLQTRSGRGDGNDTVRRVENISGSKHGDTLVGNGRANTISGRGGADFIDGRAGDDELDGGRGLDTINGRAGLDICTDGENLTSCLVGLQYTLVATLPGGANPGVAVSPPGDDRLFIVDQTGPVWVLENGALRSEPFLDVSSLTNASGEQGLLGLAFHPAFASNGKFYVNYTQPDQDQIVVEYVAPPGERATVAANSGKTIIEVAHPRSNHKGGMIEFAPDGTLLIALGDGGSGGDPDENGQDTGTRLGGILRIDVDGGDPYAVPANNPFQAGAAPELWHYGLRNPWRFSVDSATGLIYIGDVGQDAHEEVDVARWATPGLNYGWDVLEGNFCFEPSSGCSSAGTVLPVVDIPHSTTGACSVIGGYVYRGSAMPELNGHYLYSDFCARFLRSFRHSAGKATSKMTWPTVPGNPTSFGVDSSGEIYVLTTGGDVYRIDPIR